MNLKTYFLIIFLSANIISQTRWIWQNPLPQGKMMNDVQALDSLTVYTVGEGGTFLKTIDGGRKWQVIETGNMSLRSLKFTNKFNGWIAGEKGTILKTTNGGVSFFKQVTETENDLYSIDFFDDNFGIAVGINGTILKTINGGNSWQVISASSDFSFSDVFIISNNILYITGEHGIILKTTDGGMNWQNQESQTTAIFSSVYFKDEANGWICGSEGKILKTTNSGITWNPLNSNTFEWLYKIYFTDHQNGFAVGWNGALLKSTDGGESWKSLNVGSSTIIKSISFTEDKSIGWITGERGIILKTINSGDDWEFQSSGNEVEYNTIKFLNKSTGFIAGNKGLLLKTTDGGENWLQLNSGTENNLNDIAFQADKIWVVGDKGTVIRSMNEGDSWDLMNILDTKDNLYSLHMEVFDKDNSRPPLSRIVGHAGIIYESNNGGTSWTPRVNQTSYNLRAIYKLNENYTVITGDNGTIFRVMEKYWAGVRWHEMNLSQDYDIRKIFALNLHAWIVGKYGVIVKTIDGGKTWTIQTHLDVNYLNSVHFINANTGWVAGNNGRIYKTIDGGINWNLLKNNITNTFNHVYFKDENTGWAVGKGGIILKILSNENSVSNVEPDKLNIEKSIELYQNYPNPFNPFTTIEFQLREEKHVSVQVYDILGRSVGLLLDETKKPGVHKLQFDGTKLNSGTYFYRIQTNDEFRTGRMLLLK